VLLAEQLHGQGFDLGHALVVNCLAAEEGSQGVEEPVVPGREGRGVPRPEHPAVCSDDGPDLGGGGQGARPPEHHLGTVVAFDQLDLALLLAREILVEDHPGARCHSLG